VQYRLRADGADTVITLRHAALGLFPDGYRDALGGGWKSISQRLKDRLAAMA
jgi:hypothetical protein